MNIFKRTIAALGRQIDRENEATSVNMVDPKCDCYSDSWEGAYTAGCVVHSVAAEPDWKAIAEELAFELRVAGSRPYYPAEHRIFIDTVLARYEAAKQVQP